MISALLANWKAIAVIGLAALAAAFVWQVDSNGYERGYNARVAEETAALREKTDASNRANDAAARCAADPGCRLQDDGWRRD